MSRLVLFRETAPDAFFHYVPDLLAELDKAGIEAERIHSVVFHPQEAKWFALITEKQE